MVPSPCIKVCTVVGDLCTGCYRTLAEIERWPSVGDVERRAILEAVRDRRLRPER